MKSTILGLYDYNSQMSIERLPEPHSFPMFKTKVNFVDVLNALDDP